MADDTPPGPRSGSRRLLLVFAGGAVGAVLRYLITLPTPPPYGPMLATLAVNVAGAFALGLLVEVLVRRVPDDDRRSTLTLLLRTGLLGGFTTYSALGLYSAELLRAGGLGLGVGYVVATLVIGAAATGLGGWLGARLLGEPRSLA